MKYLGLFLTFFYLPVFAQTIDCQLIEKLQAAQINKKLTLRIHSVAIGNWGTLETLTEFKSAQNFKMTMKLPMHEVGMLDHLEFIVMDGILYRKTNLDTIWKYKKLTTEDSLRFHNQVPINSKLIDCKKVDTAILEGKNYDIIETKAHTPDLPNGNQIVRVWVNFKDSSIKKMQVMGNDSLRIVFEYAVVVNIEKPQNAVSDTTIFNKPKEPSHRTAPSYKEDMPRYKEGMSSLLRFMTTQLQYPQMARDAKVQGTVYIKFAVDIDGSIVNIKVDKNIGYGCDEAAIELVKKTSGNWFPALKNGKPIRELYRLPVKFSLK